MCYHFSFKLSGMHFTSLTFIDFFSKISEIFLKLLIIFDLETVQWFTKVATWLIRNLYCKIWKLTLFFQKVKCVDSIEWSAIPSGPRATRANCVKDVNSKQATARFRARSPEAKSIQKTKTDEWRLCHMSPSAAVISVKSLCGYILELFTIPCKNTVLVYRLI